MSIPLYEICNASVWRGRTKVFDRFSLQVKEGESLAILGPNGAGKTTLVQLLTRALHAEFDSQSSVRIRGKTIHNVWELRKQMGIVSRDLHDADWQCSVREAILSGFTASIGLKGVPFQMSQDRQSSVEAVSDRLGIDDLLDRPIECLSTGQQRQVLLARALVSSPSALVLDEPTSGLDLKWLSVYMNHLRALVQQGISLTLVTHHVHEIPPEVSRVIFVSGGAIVADGTREQLLQSAPLSKLFGLPLRLYPTDEGFLYVCPSR